MQIHELNSFIGSPTSTDYLAIDDGAETLKISLKDAVLAIARTISDTWVNMTTPRVNLDTTAATGTVDGDLYAAITALGWESDVIV